MAFTNDDAYWGYQRLQQMLREEYNKRFVDPSYKSLDTRGLEAIAKGLSVIKAATGDPRISEYCDKCWQLALQEFGTL